MPNEQTHPLCLDIHCVQQSLQAIEAGQNPHADGLAARREQVDWQICWLLEQLIPVLPEEMQAAVQECYETRQRVWSAAYQRAYYGQQKTSPSSLATAG